MKAVSHNQKTESLSLKENTVTRHPIKSRAGLWSAETLEDQGRVLYLCHSPVYAGSSCLVASLGWQAVEFSI